MIITNRTAGPSYSTDASAAALSATLAIGQRLPARAAVAGSAVPATAAAIDLARLYPSLFAQAEAPQPRAQIVRAVAVRCGVIAGCIATLLTVAHH